MGKKCLNCNADIENNFCSVCGQKNSTHRFSLEYIMKYDFVQGVLLLDKNFLFTLKQLFTKPGHNIREYVQGKRVKYFNYFALLLILLSINFFLSQYRAVDPIELYGKESISGYLKLSKDYRKILNIIGIPFWAGVLFLFFRKSKQNYVENIVISIYKMCAIFTLNLPFAIFSIISDDIKVLLFMNNLKALTIVTYSFLFIYQYFSSFRYNKNALILRTFLSIIVITLIEIFIEKGINLLGTIFF